MIKYLLPILGTLLISTSGICQVVENGLAGTFFKDDFESVQEYTGLSWYNSNNTTITRTGHDLKVTCTDANLNNYFGVAFPDDNFLNLSSNAKLKLKTSNTGQSSVHLGIILIDKDGKSAQIEKDITTEKKTVTFDVATGQSDIIIDLEGIHAAKWTCLNYPTDCPEIVPGFDFTSIKNIMFTFNYPNYNNSPGFTGEFLIQSIETGTSDSENGLHSSYFKDDFETPGNYQGLTWAGGQGVSTERNGHDLKVTANNAGFSTYFGVFFPEQKYLNLALNGDVRISAYNPGSTPVLLSILLEDKTGKVAQIAKDISQLKQTVTFQLLPGENEISLNVEGMHAADWTCNNANNCPEIVPGFDFTSIKNIIFLFNYQNFDGTSGYTGEFLIRSIEAGKESRFGITGEINGVREACKGDQKAYTVPEVTGANSYFWQVPEGTVIMTGQGTNLITVKFGETSGIISVTPYNANQESGYKRNLSVTVRRHLTDLSISGPQNICMNTSGVLFKVSPYTNYETINWTATEGINITSGTSPDEAIVNVGSVSGMISVTASNICGNSPAAILPVSVSIAAEKPAIQKDEQTLTATLVTGATYKWYRNNILVKTGTDNIYEAPGSGAYHVTINNNSQSDCWTASDQVFIAVSNVNGVSATHVRDDFAYPQPYVNTDGRGIFWWTGSEDVYKIKRPGGGILQIEATNADPNYSSFGLAWGGNEDGTPFTVDLTKNATMKFTAENLSDRNVILNAQIRDIHGNLAQVAEDDLEEKITAKVEIPANKTSTLEIDLTGGFKTEWICMNWPTDCPKLSEGFDWANVVSIVFQINSDSWLPNYSPFTGTINLREFEVGNIIQEEPNRRLSTVPAASYKWFRNNAEILGLNAQQIEILNAGEYKVTVTESDGTEFTSRPHRIDVITAIKENENAGFEIYPNPAEDKLMIISEKAVNSVVVKNLYGVERIKSENSQALNISSLSPGLYIVELFTTEGIKSGKFIKK